MILAVCSLFALPVFNLLRGVLSDSLSLTRRVSISGKDDESPRKSGVAGAVMVEEPPISFSPFPSTDCTLYSHFSFDDFIMVAFPDLTRDLDNQI